ncbi:hypothetical protein [Arsenicibacter rosenii]|uniref:HNH nuclease domain-containing protein n=1 Tax=Arsenicibacter rosenii TaxID=1750698 RepID=A0A1S2VHX9_9BACT|nr:hypothetical protein [Arsenicibacter rosenii]OIN57816.1 hypothetical protein BLX24_17090 [Arsenicibacter rosenii]
MRRIEKKIDSLILQEGLSYQKGDGKRIAEVLKNEQNCICAYTEEFLGRADKADVEHFDPTLKQTDSDGYQNWFLVKAQWNTEKGRTARWLKHQPLLHPTSADFEARILYEKGSYILADNSDIEARNLRRYLKLDDEGMIQQRVDYIDRIREDIALSGLSNQAFIDWRLSKPLYRSTIYYIRAIEEELNVKVNFDLLANK